MKIIPFICKNYQRILLLCIALFLLFAMFYFYLWPVLQPQPHETYFQSTLLRQQGRAGEFYRWNMDTGEYDCLYLGHEASLGAALSLFIPTKDNTDGMCGKYLPDASRDEIEEPVLYRLIAYENAYYDEEDETRIYLWRYSPSIMIEVTENYLIFTEVRNEAHYVYLSEYDMPPAVEIYDCHSLMEAAAHSEDNTTPLKECDYLYTLYAEMAPDYRFEFVR